MKCSLRFVSVRNIKFEQTQRHAISAGASGKVIVFAIQNYTIAHVSMHQNKFHGPKIRCFEIVLTYLR